MSEPLYVRCPECQGSGRVSNGADPQGRPCERCAGTGYAAIGVTVGELTAMIEREKKR